MTIQEKYDKLNEDIHKQGNLFLKIYLSNNPGDYDRAFTSIDLIEDCQNAIEEFVGIPESNVNSLHLRSVTIIVLPTRWTFFPIQNYHRLKY